jgi:alpha-galactosidase/6-phospho-beta-glucosidase family protein
MDWKSTTLLVVGNIPLAICTLIRTVKTYQTMVVEPTLNKNLLWVIQVLMNKGLAGVFNLLVSQVEDKMHVH